MKIYCVEHQWQCYSCEGGVYRAGTFLKRENAEACIKFMLDLIEQAKAIQKAVYDSAPKQPDPKDEKKHLAWAKSYQAHVKRHFDDDFVANDLASKWPLEKLKGPSDLVYQPTDWDIVEYEVADANG